MDTHQKLFFLKILHEFGFRFWHFFVTAIFYDECELKFYAEILINKIKIK
jgi:hypothetical protein